MDIYNYDLHCHTANEQAVFEKIKISEEQVLIVAFVGSQRKEFLKRITSTFKQKPSSLEIETFIANFITWFRDEYKKAKNEAFIESDRKIVDRLALCWITKKGEVALWGIGGVLFVRINQHGDTVKYLSPVEFCLNKEDRMIMIDPKNVGIIDNPNIDKKQINTHDLPKTTYPYAIISSNKEAGIPIPALPQQKTKEKEVKHSKSPYLIAAVGSVLMITMLALGFMNKNKILKLIPASPQTNVSKPSTSAVVEDTLNSQQEESVPQEDVAIIDQTIDTSLNKDTQEPLYPEEKSAELFQQAENEYHEAEGYRHKGNNIKALIMFRRAAASYEAYKRISPEDSAIINQKLNLIKRHYALLDDPSLE